MNNSQHPTKPKSTNSIVSSKNRASGWLQSLEGELGKPVSAKVVVQIVYLLLDCSGSMAESLNDAKQGALDFSRQAISDGYQVGLISFSSAAALVTPPLQNIEDLRARMAQLGVSGSTNMADAIHLGIKELTEIRGRRALVVVTDGVPDDKSAALDAAKRAVAAGIDIITVGTDGADAAFLGLLTSRSGLVVSVPRAGLATGIASASKLLLGTTPKGK